MSRWDALKPTTDQTSKPRNPQQSSVALADRKTKASSNDGTTKKWRSKRSQNAAVTNPTRSQPASSTVTRHIVDNNNSNRSNHDEGNLLGPKTREWDSILESIQQHCETDRSQKDSNNKQSSRSLAIQQSLTRLSEILSPTDSGDGSSSRSASITLPQCGRAIVCFLDQLFPTIQENIDVTQAMFQVLMQCIPNTTTIDDVSKQLGLSKQEVSRCVRTLSQTCHVEALPKETRLLIYYCLARLLRGAATVAHLPAEETAHQIVGKILLPVLSPAPNNASFPAETETLRTDVLLAIGTFLDNTKHASSLLAPLIQDVAVDGSEHQVSNPLRRQIFASLQHQLMREFPSTTIVKSEDLGAACIVQVHACRCLIKALNAAHKLEVGSNSSSKKRTESKDINLAAIESIACRMLLSKIAYSPQGLCLPALELVQAIIKHSPEASVGLGSKLLAPQTSLFQQHQSPSGVPCQQQCCPLCQKRDYELSLLMALVHGSPFGMQLGNNELFEVKVRSAAMKCLRDLIATMPLKKWLGSSSSSTRTTSSTGSVSGFGRSIVDSLETAIQTTRCLFQRPTATLSQYMELLGQLAEAVLVEIPYQEQQLPRLTNAASGLCECLGKLAMTNHRSKCLENDALQDTVVSVLVGSMGGRVTPLGYLTPMSLPTRTWLATADGSSFVRRTLDSIERVEDTRSTNASKLLRAMLRTRPETVLPHWEQMDILLRQSMCSHDPKTRLLGLELLEGLVAGRKDFGPEAEEESATSLVVPVIGLILRQSRDDVDGSCRCLTFQTYASLLARDWVIINNSGGEIGLLDHLRTIIAHCRKTPGSLDTPGEKDAKVRSAACKAIGDVCTQCISSALSEVASGGTRAILTDEDFRELFKEVYEAMLESMEDTNASVRSMALFAVGNLAYSIRCNSLGRLVEGSVVRQVSASVQRRLLDSNDKVAGNAIRSIGHLGHVLYFRETPLLPANCNGEEWDPIIFFRLVIESLSFKVERSLAAVAFTDRKNTLSWRERSVAKRHGWGACNSLAILFTCSEMVREDGNMAFCCSTAVRLLVECVERYWSLNDKVTISAMGALQALSTTSLTQLAGRSGLIGALIATCALRLFEAKTGLRRTITQKLAEENELLLGHLLTSASIMDASIVLKSEDVSKAVLEHLYEWMVEQSLDGRVFEVFALALQRPGLRVDVSLEQSFASRALQQYKLAQKDAGDYGHDIGDVDEL